LYLNLIGCTRLLLNRSGNDNDWSLVYKNQVGLDSGGSQPLTKHIKDPRRVGDTLYAQGVSTNMESAISNNARECLEP